MVSKNWPDGSKCTSVTDSKVDEADCEILAYIGGSIIHKLRTKYGPSAQQRCIDALACKSEIPCAAFTELTKGKDRGGLTYIKKSAVELFVSFENLFKSQLLHERLNVSQARYIHSCNQSLSNEFLDCINDGEDSLSFSQEVLYNVFLIFRVSFSK